MFDHPPNKSWDVFTTHWAARRLMASGLSKLIVNQIHSIWVNLEVSRIGDGWQLDHIGWEYQPGNVPFHH